MRAVLAILPLLLLSDCANPWAKVPEAELPRLIQSLKGGHYTYALPGGSQFLLQPMDESDSPGEPERKPAPKIRTE